MSAITSFDSLGVWSLCSTAKLNDSIESRGDKGAMVGDGARANYAAEATDVGRALGTIMRPVMRESTRREQSTWILEIIVR